MSCRDGLGIDWLDVGCGTSHESSVPGDALDDEFGGHDGLHHPGGTHRCGDCRVRLAAVRLHTTPRRIRITFNRW